MKKYDRLKTDLTRAISKMVHVLDLNNFDPEGVISLELKLPKLVDDNVESVISVTCSLSELQDLFEEEEIRITKRFFDEEGNQLPGIKELIYSKKLINRMA